MTAVQANKWMEENMFPFYPLGDIKLEGKLVEPKAIVEKE
jgi:2-oxoglutarate ferredoxin oxidoreductase subunit beta